MASVSDTPTLPRFTRLSPTDPFSTLHEFLWPATDRPPNPIQHGPECRGLAPYIQTYATNSEPSSRIRYIDLRKHPVLRVHALASLDTLIVRQEYVDFLAEVKVGYHFYVTGEHGIGKSVGASYLLLHLLACGQPVFFVPEPEAIYYFCDSGVQVFRGPNQGYMDSMTPIDAAVSKSWVLLDVDAVRHPKWYPRWWICLAVGLVYTALLDGRSEHHYTKQFVADTREMQPWSQEEMEALRTLEASRYVDT
ncbi:hypothetical protein FB45DRAFT_947722 [Roridomyces roridus]|uniref:Uncharacterized protein n=1 Tax=Roridomyces roridus TaxID=1738132 RepID=A0AAD7AY62_9AGAR|nr:hypothetical protein FB45DRAFT_960647 [Roridomyces roridus]KAJ7607470.1 hypothetical protein FB45DRAFT_947722 [Roridomyces roridus]